MRLVMNDLDPNIEKELIKENILQYYKHFIPQWHEKLKELEFYIDTIEDFISKCEKDEIHAIEKGAVNSKSINWTIHFPIHWDEIFRTNLRSTSIITLISLLESILCQTCSFISDLVEPPLKRNDIRGDIIRQSKKYIESFGRFSKPSMEKWNMISQIYDLRCIIVHNGSVINNNRRKSIERLSYSIPDLKIELDYVKISPDCCKFCISAVRDFCNDLHNELEITLRSYGLL